MIILKLILERIVHQFRRGILFWVIGPVLFWAVLYLGMLLALYVECQAFGYAHYYIRAIGFSRTLYCNSKPKPLLISGKEIVRLLSVNFRRKGFATGCLLLREGFWLHS